VRDTHLARDYRTFTPTTRVRWHEFDESFRSIKVQRENDALHKQAAYLAGQAREVERELWRARWGLR
jgi:hypothetical protein